MNVNSLPWASTDDLGSRREFARQNLVGQCVLQSLLNHPFQRPGAVDRVVSFFGEQVFAASVTSRV